MKNLLLILFFCPLLIRAQLLQTHSFETAMPTGWQDVTGKNWTPFFEVEGSESWSHARSPTYFRQGAYSWRVEERGTDGTVPYGSKRCEQTPITKTMAISTKANSYAFSAYIPNDAGATAWVNSSDKKIVGMQLHPWFGNTTNGFPNFSIQIYGGNWYFRVVHTGANTANDAPQLDSYTLIGPVTKGVWTDFECFVDEKKDPTGRVVVNMIVNGAKVTKSYTGYTLHGFSNHSFMKTGIYTPSIPTASTPVIVYFDMVRFGRATEATFSQVVGLGTVTPPPNIPPTCSAGSNQSLPALSTQTAFSGIDADADGTISSRLWSYVSGPAGSIINNSTTKTPTITLLQAGSYTYRYTVTDNGGATASSTVSVAVAAANIAPTNSAGTNQNLPALTVGTTLTGASSDPDGTIIGHLWTKVSGPGSQIFGSANAATTTVSQLQAGTYVFSYKVTDNNGATSTSTVGVTVATFNQPPVLTPAPDTVIINSLDSAFISCVSIDPDGLVVQRLWTQVTGPTTAIIRTANQASTIVAGLVVGKYTFNHRATDNQGAATSAPVSVIVNVPPVLTIDTSLSAMFVKGTINIPVNGSATDIDDTISSYSWVVTQGFGTFADPTAASTTFTAVGAGDYVLELTATDNHGGQTTEQYIFTIEQGWMIQNRGHRKALPLH